MKNISSGFVVISFFLLFVFGYFQGVVVPRTEMKYRQQAAIINSSQSSGSAKALQHCNPAQKKCGTIKIKKDAVPDNYQDFTFTTNIQGYQAGIILDDDATLLNPSAISNIATFYTTENGNFTISELPIQPVYNPITGQFEGGFNVSVTCVDPSGGTITTGMAASVSISNGEVVTCTFKNIPITQTVSACTPNTWTQRADYTGGGIQNLARFSIGTKGYVGIGSYGSNLGTFAYQDFWAYNQLTDMWVPRADFPGLPSMGVTSFSIGTKGYVGTGVIGGIWNSPFLQDFWQYDSASNIWTQKASLPGPGRWIATGLSVGGKGYIGLGENGATGFNDFWEYNPITNVWTQKANYGGFGRKGAFSFSINSKGYVGTGSNNFVSTQDFWEYNPITNVWTQKANYGGGPRYDATGFSIGNKGYAGTGSGYPPQTVYQDFWEYNPITNVWTQKADFAGGPRFGATGLSIGNRGYIGMGAYFEDERDWWEYCP